MVVTGVLKVSLFSRYILMSYCHLQLATEFQAIHLLLVTTVYYVEGSVAIHTDYRIIV